MAEDANLEHRVKRIVDAVVQASPPAPQPKLSFLDQQVQPLTNLMGAVSECLIRERAHASIKHQANGVQIGEMLKDYNYFIVSNSGATSSLYIRALLDMPGVIPKFGIFGLDVDAMNSLKELAGKDQWNLIHSHLPAALDVLEAYLLRFLAS